MLCRGSQSEVQQSISLHAVQLRAVVSLPLPPLARTAGRAPSLTEHNLRLRFAGARHLRLSTCLRCCRIPAPILRQRFIFRRFAHVRVHLSSVMPLWEAMTRFPPVSTPPSATFFLRQIVELEREKLPVDKPAGPW